MGGPRSAGTDAVEEEGGDVRGHPLVRVVAGVGGNVLDLHVDDGPRARLEGLRQGGDPRRELRTPALVDEPRALDLGIVVHDELAVHAPPHVELHPVGAEPEGSREGVEGVLVPGPGATPVREHLHGVLSPSQWPIHQGRTIGTSRPRARRERTDGRRAASGQRESAWAVPQRTLREHCPCLPFPTKKRAPSQWGLGGTAVQPDRPNAWYARAPSTPSGVPPVGAAEKPPGLAGDDGRADQDQPRHRPPA